MVEERNGVQRAIDKAAGDGTFYAGADAIAKLLGVKIQFIYAAANKKGYLPVDRARVVADTYGIPLVDLVKADIRAALNANS